ncbi:methyltransferase-like protein 9 [Thrips palmi]|uniref:Methyltransferase-like protein 9 n=1 Tax=Thrips palmi TaxID=161013 RepID=A0A6P9A160_THRPL|nr:methyltransferase-like protein 9 [Thrips palmi]
MKEDSEPSHGVGNSQCTEPQSTPQPGPTMETHNVQPVIPDCDCGFTHAQDSNATVPLRLRRGGSLARTLYRKTVADNELRHMNKAVWYQTRLAGCSAAVRDCFVRMDCDEETEAFLADAEAKSESILLQLWYSLVKLLLGWFFTQTSLNGFLGRGSMFVFSAAQFGRLLDGHVGRPGGRLLDIGAGDGAVTVRIESYFDQVSVTEISAPMRRILARRKYRILEIDNWADDGPWDVISCLNVLDRCSRPTDLLRQIHETLTPGGRAVIALVLPYQPYVEVGENHEPEERMPIQGSSFDEQVESFIAHVLDPVGFLVDKWTRLPYLCEGDLNQAYYWLSDAVFVVRKAEGL